MRANTLLNAILSALSAVIVLGLFATTIWTAHLSIYYGIVPSWIYAILVALGLLGLGVMGYFLGKALRGLPPFGGAGR